MFYEMLTGQRPYSGRSAMDIMAQHATSPVPRLPANVAMQQALLDRLMAKRPEQRYASADELLADLAPAGGRGRLKLARRYCDAGHIQVHDSPQHMS